MSTSINDLASELKELTAWQVTPVPLTNEDYNNIVVRAIKRLYVDTGRAAQYTNGIITLMDEKLLLNADLPLDEEQYVLLCAQIGFLKKVQQDVNERCDYTTDALEVTGASKAYGNLRDSIEKLEAERRIVYYKMTRYTLGN